MKFIERQYRTLSVWLSLAVITLAFMAGSVRSGRNICVTAAFFAGFLLYLLGTVREWQRSHMTAALIEALLAVCMLVSGILSLLRLGGIL